MKTRKIFIFWICLLYLLFYLDAVILLGCAKPILWVIAIFAMIGILYSATGANEKSQ